MTDQPTEGDVKMEDGKSHEPSSSVLCDVNCVICRELLGDDRQKVYKKGLDKLIDVSSLRGDTDLHNYLRTKPQTLPVDNVYVHKRCRADYTRDLEGDMRRATNKSKNTDSRAKRLRSSRHHLTG